MCGWALDRKCSAAQGDLGHRSQTEFIVGVKMELVF